jgi:dipeptidyl aminopeptidase/acylaminoacyl peptidase
MPMKKIRWYLAAAAAFWAVSIGRPPAAMQNAYQLPPKVVVDVLDARPLPTVIVSPSRTEMALLDRPSMLTIAELSQPMLRLAGYRINPKTNGPQMRTPGILGITLKRIAGGKEIKVAVPLKPSIGYVSFSPGGSRLAFTQTLATGIELWVADTATGAAKAVTAPTLNATGGAPCGWISDREMLCAFIVAGRGPAPAEPTVPKGPNVQENYGKPAPVSTYQDLLKTEYDEALFEYYFKSQLAFVDVATGVKTPAGKPAIFDQRDPSPDGKHLLVAMIKRPYSHLCRLRSSRRTSRSETRQGQVARKVADVPQRRPSRSTASRRAHDWRRQSPEPSTLVWWRRWTTATEEQGAEPRPHRHAEGAILPASLPSLSKSSTLRRDRGTEKAR